MYQTHQAGHARTAGLNVKRLHFWVKLLIVGNLSSCYNLSKHAVKMLRMQIVISASDSSRSRAALEEWASERPRRKKSLMNYDIGAAVRAAHHYVRVTGSLTG